MSVSVEASFWACDICTRTIAHGAPRYNCIICRNHDQCEECAKSRHPPHEHPLVQEQAYGMGDVPKNIGTSMGDIMRAIMKTYADRHCLGMRDIVNSTPQVYANSYSWITYRKLGHRSKNFGNGLRKLIKPRDYLTICGTNRPEWIMTDLACMFHGIITVPIHYLLSDREISFIINNTKVSVVVCEQKMLSRFIALGPECPSLRHIICMDKLSESSCTGTSDHDFIDQSSISKTRESQNLNCPLVHFMGDIEKAGTHEKFDYTSINPTDYLTIIYTSGSSGSPKGVIISDRAFRSLYPETIPPYSQEIVSFSYQPLSWYGGRNHIYGSLFFGGRIAFSTGDVSRLMEEVAIVRPTTFSAPPNIWNKIYSEFKTALSSAIGQDAKQNSAIEKKLLEKFSKIIPIRCNSIFIVGALVSPVVFDFLRRCFTHCLVSDGYGITECGGIAFGNRLVPTLPYRLDSVPEMGFTIDDKPFPRGELLIKSPQMFSGYINNATETRAALTDDGFFRTGDIVELRPHLNEPAEIRIIDRKKSFFKLAQGQFVSPEYLEGIFVQSPLIDQIYIHGNLYENHVTAVIVPNRACVQSMLSKENTKFSEESPQLYAALMNELRSIGSQQSLRSHEVPSRIIVDFQPFTVDNGLLTVSLKPCRPNLSSHYANRLSNTKGMEKRLKQILENITGQPLQDDNDNQGFMNNGLDSLKAVQLSRMIRDDLGITIPLDVLFDREMSFVRLTQIIQNPSSIQNKSIVSQLLNDAAIELNLTVGQPKISNDSPLKVFITGVTGFVGGFLLHRLLKQYPNNCRFVCLVRCKSNEDPLNRIKQNLSSLHLWKETFQNRILPLCGDLTQSRFGLNEENYTELANQTDIIFHCGAIVNFVLPYSQLHAANVVGTHEILRFATHGKASIPIQYISTISVLPPGILDEIPIDQISPERLTNGYGQSKWVAEKLMAKAIRSGLPVAIYRLGSMSSSSKSGACNPLDIHTILVSAILKMGYYPTEAIGSRFDVLPINFAAKTIVHLSLTQYDVYGSVYHVINPNDGLDFQSIVDGADRRGIDLRNIPLNEWRHQLSKQRSHNQLFESISQLPIESLFIRKPMLSSKRFYSVVLKDTIPSMNIEYVSKWLRFIMKHILD